MKPIGESLKIVRLARKKTFEELSDQTRIKVDFLTALEEQEWQKLPDLPILIGFVKNIADVLDVNAESLVALLKRDYKKPENRRTEAVVKIAKIATLSPKTRNIILAVATFLLCATYLGYQYILFNTPPRLSVVSPIPNQEVATMVVVRGVTDPSASVAVFSQPVTVAADGSFEEEVVVPQNLNSLEVTSTSRSGKKTSTSVPLKRLN